MSELTDDQLDGLFRKSAEEFDSPYDPAAWQDMKNRLDSNDRKVPGEVPFWKNVLRWGMVLGLVLLLLTGSVYTYRRAANNRDSSSVVAVTLPPMATNPEPQRTPKPLAKTRLAKVDSVQAKANARPVPEVERSSQPAGLEKPVSQQTEVRTESRKPTGSAVEATEPITARVPKATNGEKAAYGVKPDRTEADREATGRTGTVLSERITTRTADLKVGKPRTESSTTERSMDRKQTKNRRINRSLPSVAVNNPTMIFGASASKQPLRRNRESTISITTNTAENTNQPNGVQAEAAGLSVVHELAIRPAQWPKPLAFASRDMVVPEQPVPVESSVVPKPPVERGFSIRFAVAPDLSSVGLKNFTRPGTNVGVYLEYRLASRWSVQAGLIQSTKIYSASASEYNAPAGSYVETVKSKLGSVDGRCNMFDIPINLRYDFALRPRDSGLSPSRWFINSGVTSYYIKQEDYVYNYTGYVHNAVPAWSTKTGGYGFSNLNLSVGYERALTKRLSWQIEPFMKVPLKGVGFFKIDLLSTGTFFSIRYKL